MLANPTQPWLYCGVGSALLVAMSVMMTPIFNSTLPPVLLMALTHAMYDTVSIAVTPLIETDMPLLAFALSAGVAWFVAAAALILTRRQNITQEIQVWRHSTSVE